MKLFFALACPLAHPLASFIEEFHSSNYGVNSYGLEASQQASKAKKQTYLFNLFFFINLCYCSFKLSYFH